jgi:glycosyltransferase involved in cell wall biosynthesis
MNLPRLLYLSDVPVESSYHGSALLHRLLTEWPPEKLMLVEPSFAQSQVGRRLPKAGYLTLPFGIPRLLHSRLADVYGSWVLVTAKSRREPLGRLLGDFQPEAVLTVAHGYSWLTAAAFAEKCRLPLHLILHDDWLFGLRVLSAMKPLAERWFGQYYRQAVSRFCVSPGMVESCQRMFGVGGTILYPSRATDCPAFEQPPARIAGDLPHPKVAFAGTVNGTGYVRALRDIATALMPLQGRLLIYGPLTQSEAEKVGLNLPNVELRGLIKSNELVSRLRDEADLLYVPMSFCESDRTNMEVSFPSKLTDYTATGIPLLIRGPAYCSAIRWARENPGVAEVVDSENGAALAVALALFCRDGSLRYQLASNALQKGREYFSHTAAIRKFFSSFPKA